MKKILINASNVRFGGGVVILEGVLDYISVNELEAKFLVLIDHALLNKFICKYPMLDIIRLPNVFKGGAAAFAHLTYIPYLSKRLYIDAILNLGNFSSSSRCCPQITYLHWPYAVYERKFWGDGLSIEEKINRYIRKFLFYYTQRFSNKFIVQSETIKRRLRFKYSVSNEDVMVVSPVVDIIIDNIESRKVEMSELGQYIFYPAYYYPHKNHSILLEVAKLLKERKSKITIVITLDESTHFWDSFKNNLNYLGISNHLVNVGTLSRTEVKHYIENSEALFMPTLLETFGIPYVESMHSEKPILTSNLDFAHEVCGECATYFDPQDPLSIAETILDFENSSKINFSSEIFMLQLKKLKLNSMSMKNVIDTLLLL